MLRSEKVATPATAATVVLPERTAPAVPVPLAIARVVLPVKVFTRFRSESSTDTSIGGVMTAPCAVFTGWVLKLS